MDAPVIVKIEVDAMRAQVARFIAIHHDELQQQVAAALESFPWREQIRSAAYDAVRKHLSYSIGAAVGRAIDRELEAEMYEAAIKGAREVLEEKQKIYGTKKGKK
jgi:hypothetical protein